jgi:putative transcription factor
LGSIQKEAPRSRNLVSNKKQAKKQQGNKNRNSVSSRVYTRNTESDEELVDDFSQIVRKGRESKGWTREELGAKIYEKVSVITRIETGKMEPDLKLAKKLEKTLNIKLIEKYDEMDLESFKSMASGPNTLGSIVKIKRK